MILIKYCYTKEVNNENCQKIVDKSGNDVTYTIDYSKEETDINNTVFAKEYTFTPEMLMLKLRQMISALHI